MARGGVNRRVPSRSGSRRRDVCVDGPRTCRTHQAPRQASNPDNTNAPASAEAQPSGGHRHQRRASQRCSFEWRRHPWWASCRANYRIKRASRDVRFRVEEMAGSQKGGWVVVEGAGSRKNLGQNLVASRSARAPKWRGRCFGVGSGRFTLCCPRRCQRSQPPASLQRQGTQISSAGLESLEPEYTRPQVRNSTCPIGPSPCAVSVWKAFGKTGQLGWGILLSNDLLQPGHAGIAEPQTFSQPSPSYHSTQYSQTRPCCTEHQRARLQTSKLSERTESGSQVIQAAPYPPDHRSPRIPIYPGLGLFLQHPSIHHPFQTWGWPGRAPLR